MYSGKKVPCWKENLLATISSPFVTMTIYEEGLCKYWFPHRGLPLPIKSAGNISCTTFRELNLFGHGM